MNDLEQPPVNVDPDAPVQHAGAGFRVGLGPGLVAGLVMLIVLGILALARDQPFLEPADVIASVFQGPRALSGSAEAAALGVVVHFATSAILGGLFAVVVGRTTRKRQLGLGLAYGVAIWLVVQFAFLPLAAPWVATTFGTVWPFFLGHLAFGVMLGASVPTTKGIDAPHRAFVDPLRREVRP